MPETIQDENLWTPGRVAHELAQQAPDETAVLLLCQDGQVKTLSRSELDNWSSRLAHALASA